MIGLALSGGGSRAVAFHLGCLRALEDLGILSQVQVLSTISGGSVIGAHYAYTPHKSFTAFESEIRALLRTGLHRRIAGAILQPWNFVRCMGSAIACRADLLLAGVRRREPTLLRYPSRSDLFAEVLRRDLFQQLPLAAPRRHGLQIVIGACELRTGTAFRFSNDRAGSWRHGEALNAEIDVAFAVAASAAYPLLLPALDRRWRFRRRGQESEERVLLTDGGVYDNLGIGVIEPGRSPEYSLHAHPCEYLIACSAGQGQSSGLQLPTGLLGRVDRSFNVVHRRVQDSAMQRLHGLRETDAIKGFALPYLGQQDHKLPYRPPDLVPRADVINYPTDFAAMPEAWINRLSMRGEQLTRLLVPHYLPSICR